MPFKLYMKCTLPFLLLVLVVFSCKTETNKAEEIAKINTDVNIERFDLLLSNITAKELPKLKHEYPFMFSEKFKDSFWLDKVSDTLQQMLFKEVKTSFKDFTSVENDIESLFNHLSFYFPEFTPPRLITATNDVDYRFKIVVTDTIAIVALDNYLGANHEFYSNIPRYIRANFEEEQIVVDLAAKYAEKYIYQAQNKTFLDEMIYFGKQLYFKDVMVPFKTSAERIGYSLEELEWAQINESDIWRNFVENELLFSTDSKLPSRFINPAPFSKFYLEGIDKESPGRLGQYIGWQIVRAYMEQNDVSLKKMLITSPEEIFNNTKYKPKK